ncbi:MAG: hypothetical protein QM763_02790 [Agriterribacter sp.]
MKKTINISSINLSELSLDETIDISGGHDGGSYNFGKAVGESIRNGLKAAGEAIGNFFEGVAKGLSKI